MRRLNPNDADLFVNFKEDPGVQFKQETGVPSAHVGAAFERAWDSEGAVFVDPVAPQVDDVQVMSPLTGTLCHVHVDFVLGRSARPRRSYLWTAASRR